MSYHATFTRYSSTTGERHVSVNTPLHGLGREPSFDDACQYAKALLTGMSAADPSNKYQIVSVNLGHDTQGTGHLSGIAACGPGVWDMPVVAFYEVERKDNPPLIYYYVGRTHEDKMHFRGERSEAVLLSPMSLAAVMAEAKKQFPDKKIKTISAAR